MNLKKNGKILTSESVVTGPSSYEKRNYRAAVSQRLRNTDKGFMCAELTHVARKSIVQHTVTQNKLENVHIV